MKILIVYATRGGAAEHAASLLAAHFDNPDVKNLRDESPDPSGYDFIIFGSGIRFGNIYRELSDWLDRFWEVLRRKPKAVFICNVFEEEAEEIIKKNFSLRLRNSSVAVDSLGGEYDPAKLSRTDRMLAYAMKRELLSPGFLEMKPCILTWRVDRFLQDIDDYLELGSSNSVRPGSVAAIGESAQ